jgi:hypothetical protein
MSPIDYLFERFKNMYMNKWTSQFSSPRDLSGWKEAWAEELSEQGITFTEVKNGLDYCKKNHQEWPPTFPQFLEACRPSIDFESAYNEALVQMAKRETGEDVWSHPAIFWAYRALGSDIKGSTYALIKKRWEVALNASIEGVESGKIEPVVPKKEMPAGYLPRPKREHGNYSKVALEEIAKQKIILETEPAWKKKLKGQGMDRVDTGFKQVSECLEGEVLF